jgi:glycosyltransferase involved in cell wall biosynthesis
MTYHIAHILPFPSMGGVEVAALRLMESLEGEQFRNTAFHVRGAESVARAFGAAGFETVGHDQVEPSYLHPRAFFQNSLRLAREFRQRGVNLVHCQDLLAAHYTALAGRLAGAPVLCHVRSQHRDISRRDAGFLRAVNHFVFVSHNAQESFGLQVGPTRGTVIYDGFDFVEADAAAARRDVFREFGIPAQTRVVGMVARVARQKDYPTLVRAAARVVAAGLAVRFLVVGDYDGQPDYSLHYQEVRAMIADAGLTQHFTFTGHREDVIRFLAAMDVHVLCTHSEGFALAALEAMAQRVPVVATAVGGLPEFVIEGKTGLLHAHGDDAGLAEKLLALLNDPALAARLAAAGHHLITTKFSRQHTLEDTTRLYHAMLKGGRRSTLHDRPAQRLAGTR